MMHELLILFLFSFATSLLLWFMGSSLTGFMSAAGWIATSIYWIGDGAVIPSIAWLWIGLGIVNFFLSFYSIFQTRREQSEEMTLF